jgi:hypothetical protein
MPRKNGIIRRTKPCHGRPPTKRARHNENGAPVRQGVPTDANMQLLEEAGKTTSLLASVDDMAPELKARIYQESETYGQQLAYQEMQNLKQHQEQQELLQHQNTDATGGGGTQ